MSTPFTVYAEPYSRYSLGKTGSGGAIIVNSSLTQFIVDGSTDPNIFTPELVNPVAGTIVYNTVDGNTYIFDGTTWNSLLTFNETALTPYVLVNTPTGQQWVSQPMVAKNLVYHLTPYSPITVYPLERMKGIGLSITRINGVPAVVNTRYVLPVATAYVIKMANEGLVFNPTESFFNVPVGEQITQVVTLTVTDAAQQTVSVVVNFIVEQPTTPGKTQSHINNLVFKHNHILAGSTFSVLSKNLAGTDLVSQQVAGPFPIPLDDISALGYDATTAQLYAMQKIGTTRTLVSISAANNFSFVPFVANTQLAAGEVPATVQTGYTRAGSVSQKDGIGFYVNQEAAGINYAAVVTMPGYVPNTIPTITQPGIAVPVRDNASNGVATLLNRIRGSMAWNPLNNRFYSIAMNGGTVTSGIGTAPGAAGTFVLVENTLNYSTYNPTTANPYVGNTFQVFNLTFPAPLPAGPQFAQTADSMFIDNSGMLYVFGITTGPTSNSYLFSVNLALLPTPPVVIVNSSSIITSQGDAATSANAPSTINTPDLSLGDNGLPVSTTTARNSYINFDTSALANTPIVTSSVAQRVIKPITVSSASPIARLHIEIERNEASPILFITLIQQATLPDIASVNLIGGHVRFTYEGPFTVAYVTQLIEGARYYDTYKQDREERVVVWVDAINGVSSIKRTAYINVF